MAIDLSSISKRAAIRAPKVLIYGTQGVGKTRFASGDTRNGVEIPGAPEPIFLCTEEGLSTSTVARFNHDGDDYVLRTFQEVLDCIAVLLTNDHPYRTLVIDTLDGLEPLVWSQVCLDYGKVASIEKVEKGYGKGYTIALNYWERIKTGIDALRLRKSMIAILIAHSHVKRYENPEGDPYDRYQMRLNDKVADFWSSWCDVQLFARHEVHFTGTEDKAGKKKSQGIGSGRRLVQTIEAPAYKAKNRYGLPEELALEWSAFSDAVTTSMVEAATDDPGAKAETLGETVPAKERRKRRTKAEIEADKNKVAADAAVPSDEVPF